MGKQWKQCQTIFLGSKITADGDCNHEIGAGALGRPRGMVWGGRREEGSGWKTHVYLWWVHFDIWQNQYNIVKFKNEIKLKKKRCLLLGRKMQPTRLLHPWVFQARVLQWGAIAFSDDQPRQHIKEQRHSFANKGPSSQSYGFCSSHVWM